MRLYPLDVRKSHELNSDCPMRIIQDANGHWYCLDCNLCILSVDIEVIPKPAAQMEGEHAEGA